MPLPDLLVSERIVLLSHPGNRDSVLDAAARLLSGSSPTLTSAIGDALRDREQVASTAIGHGVAIPHARGKAFEHARGAFLRLASPVDFGRGQHVPVDLVFAMYVPEHSPQLHLQALSDLADRFGSAPFRDALRDARDLPRLRDLLLDRARAVITAT